MDEVCGKCMGKVRRVGGEVLASGLHRPEIADPAVPAPWDRARLADRHCSSKGTSKSANPYLNLGMMYCSKMKAVFQVDGVHVF